MDLTHLIYVSTAAFEFSEGELITLLEQTRKSNKLNQLSGILLVINRNFFQILEGDRHDVMFIFEKIKKDPRHENIVQIIFEPIPKRDFGEWTMGFIETKAEKLKQIEGFNDFFKEGTSLTNLDPGRAKKLLTAFSNGIWHQDIS